MNKLEEDILYYKYLYYEKGISLVSDYTYDLLEKRLKKEFPESKILDMIECPMEFWNKYEERYKNEY